ncbi:hypothetical protein QVD99_008439 [Batrachochytrium dendrobatidis]|nr:hypothetical protein O5D80_007311 [Batrachochytrium dendrobatidis]KAK5664901.1 hypothetical protein QVD99_008439 [Batrachochytrium dendrobatidis]
MLVYILLLQLLVQGLIAVPISEDTLGEQNTVTIIRYDRDSPFDQTRRKSSFLSTLSPITDGITRLGVQRVAVQPFQFTFICTDAPPDVCAQARAGFERAGQLIAKSMQITKTINVQARYRSFCNSAPPGQGCMLNNTLGQASAAAYFSAKTGESDDWAFYPQALVKQLPRDHVLEFNKFDILAEFNADYSFYFRGFNRPIQPTETDFEFVVCHELTHGLGFDTAWASYYSVYQGLTKDSSYLAPLVYANGTTPENSIVSNMEPINIFDTFQQRSSDNAALKDMARAIASFPSTDINIIDYIKAFQVSGGPYNAARQVFSAVTAGVRSIYFKPKTGSSRIYLQTKKDIFQPGSSIAHLDYEQYWNGPDFLMIPAMQNLTGYTLDSIIAANTRNVGLNGGIYGPNIQSIMQAMGWPLLTDSIVSRISINPTPEKMKSGCLSDYANKMVLTIALTLLSVAMHLM